MAGAAKAGGKGFAAPSNPQLAGVCSHIECSQSGKLDFEWGKDREGGNRKG